jgi:hypothetical protein
MELSVHAVIVPDVRVSGILVFDAEGFDYVPLRGDERGQAFTAHLRQGLENGFPPGELLAHFFDKGGPHLYESLSAPIPVEAPTRLAALYRRAGAEGWELDAEHRVHASPPPEPVAVPEPELPELPRSLVQAMVLLTLSALYRRHHRAHDLRLFEMHPGGGMYDGYTLVIPPKMINLCFFNVAGTGLLLHEVGEPRPPEGADERWFDNVWRYPRAFLTVGGAVRLADRMEARLGLEPVRQTPAPSPSSIVVATFAELARRYALSDRAPHFRSGWLDTSGMVPSSVRPWVRRFTEVQARCDAADGWPAAALVANRLWGVDGEERAMDDPRVVVDLGTGTVFLEGEPAGSLWHRYQKGEGLRSLAWWLERLWRR